MNPAVCIDAGAERSTAMQTDRRVAWRRADPEGGTPRKFKIFGLDPEGGTPKTILWRKRNNESKSQKK
jgi:hypothetical protein